MRVFIVAGEASGDVLGGHVLAALKTKYGENLRIAGLGGTHMAAQGLNSLFPMSDVAVMGIVEVLRRYRFLMGRIRELKAAVQAFSPDVLLMIDAQGLSYRLGKHFADAPFGKIQLVAPTVWAWKPERAAKVATYLDHIACLFPFEGPYFEREGLAATFVGHPAMNLTQSKTKADARASLGLPDGETWAAVLPGSRVSETSQLCPVFHRLICMGISAGHIQGVLIPAADTVGDRVRAWSKTLPCPVHLLENPEDRANLPAADLALAASGTVSLELSAQGIPSILAYRVHALSYAYIRRRLTAKYMGLTNLLAGAEIQREFKLNERSQAELATAFAALASSTKAQDQVRQAQYAALTALKLDDGLDFGTRVAALI